ncbi:glycosyltransferase [Aliarcobacter cryaerophilus]|uniref:glycosyltransferase n=1 Tax=Aliarcobacter cryaerophilus TaxID=28198 RepID=UPI0008270B39|nr:glycosyltransferase [Aliarcobacter cryaerophilus]MCT7509560.1 glycosyltransferase [Aliarcobacter cryaerophilus]
MKDVTILIPAYNEEKHIEQAILSAVTQAEFVIVSDNCSTDKTPEICKKLAKEHKNLIFYEQKENIGSVMNFHFLLDKVKTKYTLHIGAHDFISENYTSSLKKALEENFNAVLAYTSFSSVDDNGNILNEQSLEEFKNIFLSNNPVERVIGTIEHYNQYIFMIFGLFKTNIFKKNLSRPKIIAGIDCLFLSICANDGTFIKIDSEKFFRRVINRKENQTTYMERIEGKQQTTTYDLSYMCSEQFQLVKTITKNNQQQKYILNKLSLSMDRLFGKFSYKSLTKTLYEMSKTDEKYILYGAGLDSDYILSILNKKILFIVDQDPKKQNTIKNGIEIKSPAVLEKYENKIIISLIGRVDQVSKDLINQYSIDSKRIISPIDYSYRTLN